jgi:hypothetical protein
VHRLHEDLRAEKAVLEEQLAALCKLHTADQADHDSTDAAAVHSAVSKKRSAVLPVEAQQTVALSANGRRVSRHISSHVSVHSSEGDAMSVDGSVHEDVDAAQYRVDGLMSRGTALLPAAAAALIEGHLLVHRAQLNEPLRNSSSSQLQVRCDALI